jgi:hypothetical protein
MIRKSGNRFSEKVMLKQTDEIMIPRDRDLRGDAVFAPQMVRFTDRWGTMVRRQKPATGVHAAGP